MTKVIVLKDASNADITFNLVSGENPSQIVYENPVGPILGRKRIVFSMKQNSNVNRVKARIAIPSTSVDPVTGKSTVVWTNVASLDVSSVLFAPVDAATNLMALFGSLSKHASVLAMVTDGVNPAI